ncbi:hypothetical protein IMZ48_15150 [Candidatus Bathyarchaeota archaeon]|nr:hypothetical protein [Candidatus Bathyarchaeota archaeon]
MGTKGRLLRKFPGVAIQVPTAKLEPALIRTVACTLERMSGQVVLETIPTDTQRTRGTAPAGRRSSLTPMTLLVPAKPCDAGF